MDELLEIFKKYNCHLDRKNVSSVNFLQDNFNKYIGDLKNSLKYEGNPLVGVVMCKMVTEKINDIEANSKSLIEVLKLYSQGKIVAASQKAFKVFDNMKSQLMQRYSGPYRPEIYYRIRKIDDSDPFSLKRKELFHIPYFKNHLVGTERYSMPGHPCLYLASKAELCWYECGMPKKFAISKFDIPQTEDSNLRFIDFSEKLMPLMKSFFNWFHNENDIEQVRNYLLKYIYTYPLRAACSLAVKHPDGKFIEEYIIPQLLLQWVINDEDFDGIRYESCSSSDKVNDIGGHNIVLVTNNFDGEGYDVKLRNSIKIGTPKVYDVNSIKIDDRLKDCLEERNIKEDPFLWSLSSIPDDFRNF